MRTTRTTGLHHRRARSTRRAQARAHSVTHSFIHSTPHVRHVHALCVASSCARGFAAVSFQLVYVAYVPLFLLRFPLSLPSSSLRRCLAGHVRLPLLCLVTVSGSVLFLRFLRPLWTGSVRRSWTTRRYWPPTRGWIWRRQSWGYVRFRSRRLMVWTPRLVGAGCPRCDRRPVRLRTPLLREIPHLRTGTVYMNALSNGVGHTLPDGFPSDSAVLP